MQQIITVDGAAGVGKGTLSRQLARHLNWHFLDSGAIYRLTALMVQQQHIEQTAQPICHAIETKMQLDFQTGPQGVTIWLNHQNVTDEIRQEAIGMLASKIAAMGQVRQALLQKQRNFARCPGLVADGRDMGTVVFPEASLKFYLYASAEVRAQRRYEQLLQQGQTPDYQAILTQLQQRDAQDQNRKTAPLKPAQDAVLIDTGTLDIQQVFNQAMVYVAKVFNQSGLS